MTNTTIKTNNEAINNTMIMEDGTMMNYKEMKWVEVVAYAKGLGINTGHKKRVEIESDIETYFANQNVVPVGDMSSDKYYPELQEEQPEEKKSETIEEKITAAINRAKFNATYNNTPVTYIMTKSLKTIIKYNLKEEHRKHAQVDAIVERVIQKMVTKGVLYKCNDKFYGVK
jgi:hypothetical protein